MNNETIGQRLRKARQAKKITLDQVYSKTKIHVDILQALEDDRFQEYSPIYIKGFLKIYSRFLGLDTDGILKEFQQLYLSEDSLSIEKETSIKKLKFKINLSKLNSRLIKKIVTALIVVGVLISFLFFLKNLRNKATVVSKTSQSEEAIIPAQKTEKVKFARLAIRAKDNCWLKIRLDGKLVYDGAFKKNMAESWQAKEKIELSVGNAGAIEAEINGQLLSPLGRKGQSIKNIVITKDGFSIGKPR
jgi:transcriptional regulator with XRE-family HTH domain